MQVYLFFRQRIPLLPILNYCILEWVVDQVDGTVALIHKRARGYPFFLSQRTASGKYVAVWSFTQPATVEKEGSSQRSGGVIFKTKQILSRDSTCIPFG